MLEIKIKNLGSNSVAGFFLKLYLNTGSSLQFSDWMQTFHSVDVYAQYFSIANSEIDNKVIQGNKEFCSAFGLGFYCDVK